jgi:hypothetical protein
VSLDGRFIVSSTPAVVERGIVFAPLDPFGRALANRIDIDVSRRTIRFMRGDRFIVLPILPIAPYVRDEPIVIPLALVARALGATVTYSGGAGRFLAITSPPPSMLATLPPYVPTSLPPQPGPTFTPTPEPMPRPTVTGIPQPRRTPIRVHSL